MPLAKIHLDSPLYEGEVIVGVCEHEFLPIPDCDFLLSNDIGGGKVLPPLKVTDSPVPYNPTEELESTQPTLFPTCAVTRAQARQQPPPPPPPALSRPSQIDSDHLFSQKVLFEAQREDPTLSKLLSKVVPRDQVTHYPSYYYHDDILMRVFRRPQLSDEDTWAEVLYTKSCYLVI